MDLFRTNWIFYVAHFLQLIVIDLIAWAIMSYSGYQNWYTYFLAAILLTTSQVYINQLKEMRSNSTIVISNLTFNLKKAQAGWLQHDFGHLSVFKSNKMNHFVHRVIIGWFKVKKNNEYCLINACF